MPEERITSTYLHQLQAAYYEIGERGIRIDRDRIEAAKRKVSTLIDEQLAIATAQWNCRVYIGAANAVKGDTNSVNLNSTAGEKSLLNMMKNLGYDVPLITKKNSETNEYESKYSTGELALQKMLASNKFKHPAGDPAIRAILRVRELGKLNSAYLNARLCKRGDEYYFLSSYNVAGTLTGRRSSKKHAFGFGNNGQNFPSHSDIAAIFRSCLVARQGNIFLMVDQMQAEDWPVSALSQNWEALKDLKSNTDPILANRVDRHSKLATMVFGQFIPAKTDPRWDKKLHDGPRYLGKKFRHGSNYGMKGGRMSDSLAQEGRALSKDTCTAMLEKVHQIDPSIRGTFHKYVKDELEAHQMLKTPFGRERMFLSARPNSDNNSVFNEAFAYIPQSTVGDNTGFAVYYLESNRADDYLLIQEGHDSIVQDIPNSVVSILGNLIRTQDAFKRTIRFHNGIEIEIPIEAELGYDFDLKVSIDSFDEKGVREALDNLNAKVEKRRQKEAVDAAQTNQDVLQ
jgi:DNA polymerase I-like protein with 3'-5' exonuclease and polymerase domains